MVNFVAYDNLPAKKLHSPINYLNYEEKKYEN
jgi:hypothetical protein